MFGMKNILVAGLLVWLHLGSLFVLVFLFLAVLIYLPTVRNMWAIYFLYKESERRRCLVGDCNVLDDDAFPPLSNNLLEVTSTDDNKAAIYKVFEKFRITRPTEFCCWEYLLLEIVFFFIYPFGVLIIYDCAGFILIAFFLLTALFTGSRFYLNPSEVVMELGSMGNLVRNK